MKPHRFFLCKTQYPSFQNSDFGGIALHRHRKVILTFESNVFSWDFAIATVDVITYYIVFLSFPDPQAKFS